MLVYANTDVGVGWKFYDFAVTLHGKRRDCFERKLACLFILGGATRDGPAKKAI